MLEIEEKESTHDMIVIPEDFCTVINRRFFYLVSSVFIIFPTPYTSRYLLRQRQYQKLFFISFFLQ